MMKTRGFELVTTYQDAGLTLPVRSTAHAAGYDFSAAETVILQAGEIKLIPTGIKAYMQAGEVLYLYDSPSNPRKKGLVMINSVGVIDGVYYGNVDNEGHIFTHMKNITDGVLHVTKIERIAQGVFVPYVLADADDSAGTRVGG